MTSWVQKLNQQGFNWWTTTHLEMLNYFHFKTKRQGQFCRSWSLLLVFDFRKHFVSVHIHQSIYWHIGSFEGNLFLIVHNGDRSDCLLHLKDKQKSCYIVWRHNTSTRIHKTRGYKSSKTVFIKFKTLWGTTVTFWGSLQVITAIV